MNIPFRYDLPNANFVNKKISDLNRKLLKLTNAFQHTSFLKTDNDRDLFTNHGLHLNKLGKQLVHYQIASFLCYVFEPKNIVPITLKWYETHEDDNLTYDENIVQTTKRNLYHNRKPPVTRSKDFLWQI